MDSYFYRFEEESLDPKESIREKTHLITIHLHEWIFTYQDNFKINVLVSVTFIITRLTEIDIAPLPLFRMCIFEAAHGMTGGEVGRKIPPPYNLLHISYNGETWHSYTLPKGDSKNIWITIFADITRNQQILLYQEIQI